MPDADIGFLANLLALPRTLEGEQATTMQARDLLAKLAAPTQPGGAPLLSPGEIQAVAPSQPLAEGYGQFAGNHPIVGSILRGIGTVGQVLQAGTGGAPPAPRPLSLSALSELSGLRTKRDQAEARERLGTLVEPQSHIAAEALRAGYPKAAMNYISPTGTENPNAWIKRAVDLSHGATPLPGDHPADYLHEWEATQAGAAAAKRPDEWLHMTVVDLAGIASRPGPDQARAQAHLDKFNETSGAHAEATALGRRRGDPRIPTLGQLFVEEGQKLGLSGAALTDHVMQRRVQDETQRIEANEFTKKKYRPFNVAAQKALATLDVTDGLIASLEEALKDPAVLRNRNMLAGVFHEKARQHSIPLAESEDAYITLRQQLEIVAPNIYTHNRIGAFQYIVDARKHLPLPGDTPERIFEKLEKLKKLSYAYRSSVADYALLTPYDMKKRLLKMQPRYAPLAEGQPVAPPIGVQPTSPSALRDFLESEDRYPNAE